MYAAMVRWSSSLIARLTPGICAPVDPLPLCTPPEGERGPGGRGSTPTMIGISGYRVVFESSYTGRFRPSWLSLCPRCRVWHSIRRCRWLACLAS
ncbi:uncharacterized protein K452DRAFT_86565 [Aplosporella prunicola CBS 121167]|uniref:Uncharacterized protein n=1 Tax=Aplosporella prunicola CBS 121167 TaxID=1176127 RepID=A0A6A6B477_9PEZI|nr:uncharacterized protein K452DRAFT_86565 [Aplosporella prunicola CBS 121167]KAF2138428.1 hypothetical protein K452DRAFT_86565 [Aplosporella prunicola CBS 121167]